MKNFKLKLSTLTLGLISINVSAQQLPTNTSPAGVGPSGQNNAQFWSRAGNSNAIGINNIFGTNFNSPVYHYTTGKQRMIVFDDTWNTAGSLPFGGSSTPNGGGLALNLNPASPVTRPAALLTIANGNPNFNGGWRNWMQVGTFNYEGFNQLYVGMKPNTGPGGGADALINWGDNTVAFGATPAFIRFNFTAPLNGLGYPPFQSAAGGLDVMRMNWEGKVGIGNYENNPIESPFTKNPARRLEILSDKAATGANGNPTFRMTHTQQNPGALLTTGKYSEFEDRNTGDLFINTRDNTLVTTGTRDFKQRYIGVNTNTPGNTMEINSQYSNALTPNGFGGTGWAGVRFTDLKSASIAQPNPSANVLSVNTNGDVILVPGGPNISNNGISVNAGAIQLGVPCTLPGGGVNFSGLGATALTTDRAIFIGNEHFWFADLNTNTGGVGVGGNPASVGFCGTGNTFEISANLNNTRYGNVGASGLRLTKLVPTSTTIPNGTYGVNSSKVLTVDENGDVVLTDVNPGLGNICGAASNSLTNNYEIPMNGFNFNYTMPALSTSQVNIGFSTCLTPSNARLGVLNDVYSRAGNFSSNLNFGTILYGVVGNSNNTGTGNATGVYGKASSVNPNSTAIGVQGDAVGSTAPTNKGVYGFARNAMFKSLAGSFDVITSTSNVNSGVEVIIDMGTNATSTNYGIKTSVANVGTSNYGGYFAATGAANNYGVYASATPTTGLGGPNYAGFFNGSVYISGSYGPSDINLKQNIDTIPSALATINLLKPKTFDYKHASYPSMSLPQGKQYGLIAQEVEIILPALVTNNVNPPILDSMGSVITPAVNFKGLEYQQLIPILIGAVQQLSAQNKKQDSLITALTTQINACCSSGEKKINTSTVYNQLDIELSDKDAIVLNQNVPNPFAEQTTITYNVPVSVSKAQLLFFNANGQVIQTVDIKTRGKGKVNVFASDLSAGLYHYTLVADGKVVDSKKMVRE